MTPETTIRAGAVSFIFKATHWPDPEAGKRALDYLATHLQNLTEMQRRTLHQAMMQEQTHPDEALPYAEGQALADLRDHEQRAVLFAVADSSLAGATGPAVRLYPANDGMEGEP